MRTALLQSPAAHPAQTPNIPLLGWIYAQLREAGWERDGARAGYLQGADVGQHPRQLLQHVPTDIQSPQAPQAAHAPGQLPQLVPCRDRKAT